MTGHEGSGKGSDEGVTAGVLGQGCPFPLSKGGEPFPDLSWGPGSLRPPPTTTQWPVGLSPGGCDSFAEVTLLDLATKCWLAAPRSSGGRAGSCLVPTWPCVAALAGLALAPLSLAGRRAAIVRQDKPLPLAFVPRGPCTDSRLPDRPSRGALGQARLTPQGTALPPVTVLLQVHAAQETPRPPTAPEGVRRPFLDAPRIHGPVLASRKLSRLISFGKREPPDASHSRSLVRPGTPSCLSPSRRVQPAQGMEVGPPPTRGNPDTAEAPDWGALATLCPHLCLKSEACYPGVPSRACGNQTCLLSTPGPSQPTTHFAATGSAGEGD
uniref:Uncharacterized protein LOC117312362 n=1 Tax=Tursiops truncatus TaxID=9739 RepID=A0A6J3RD41_TURTR|nr:uncharacterized protein LOC117312362 [Tursiops truncatus]XP_033712491.1 uncharacterized protein LOC117312362 [Tursiops truncatus]XP_033712492.1 uncharacterized protein LOC117312362 [Tursiops truncatus]